MHNKLKIELHKAGFEETTAQEYLGASDAEVLYVHLKIALSQILKEKRNRLGVTQSDLAKALGTTQGKLSQMENGSGEVTVDRIFRSLHKIGVSNKEIAQRILKAH